MTMPIGAGRQPEDGRPLDELATAQPAGSERLDGVELQWDRRSAYLVQLGIVHRPISSNEYASVATIGTAMCARYAVAGRRFLLAGPRCSDTVLAPLPTVNEPPGCGWAILPPCASPPPPDPAQRPAGPALPGRLGPRPAPLVRRDGRPGGDRRGRGGGRLGRHDGWLRGVRAPVRRRGPAGHRAACPGPRDDRLPCRTVLAARGRPVGHPRPGRRAPGRDLVRWRDRRPAGLCLVRDAPATGGPRRIGASAAR